MVLPREVDEITRAFLGLADQQAPGLVRGLYLRGSLGFGEYFPGSWHELARHAITMRGPELSGRAVWTDDAALWAYSHANLSSYWAGIADALAADPAAAATDEAAAWCVLGISRLHHLLAAGSLTSKSGAGRHALTAFGPRWHPIIAEALRAREHPETPSAFAANLAERGRETIAFTVMALAAGLACRL